MATALHWKPLTFVGKLPTNSLRAFGHFVGLSLKGLNVWQCSECVSAHGDIISMLCLNNSLLICTVTLFSTASDTFRILAYSVLGFIRCKPAYSVLLRHIHLYWGIIKAYSDIFNTLCNRRILAALPYSEPWHI